MQEAAAGGQEAAAAPGKDAAGVPKGMAAILKAAAARYEVAAGWREGNTLGLFVIGQVVKVLTEVSNSTGTRTSAVRMCGRIPGICE